MGLHCLPKYLFRGSVFNPINPCILVDFPTNESDTMSMTLVCSLCTFRDHR